MHPPHPPPPAPLGTPSPSAGRRWNAPVAAAAAVDIVDRIGVTTTTTATTGLDQPATGKHDCAAPTTTRTVLGQRIGGDAVCAAGAVTPSAVRVPVTGRVHLEHLPRRHRHRRVGEARKAPRPAIRPDLAAPGSDRHHPGQGHAVRHACRLLLVLAGAVESHVGVGGQRHRTVAQTVARQERDILRAADGVARPAAPPAARRGRRRHFGVTARPPIPAAAAAAGATTAGQGGAAVTGGAIDDV